MLQHHGHHSIIKILLLYNQIWTTFFLSIFFFQDLGLYSYHSNPSKDWTPYGPSAFRPIAFTSCLCKVTARMVKRRLFVLEAKGFLGDEQPGFRKYQSTMYHLTHLEHCISEAFAKKRIYDRGVPGHPESLRLDMATRYFHETLHSWCQR